MTLIGYDTTDGLDGRTIVHQMAPEGGNIVVIGPQDEVEPFRERFLGRVEDEVLIIDADFAERSLETIKSEVQMEMEERNPSLVYVRNVDRAYTPQWDYIYLLLTQGYASNLSVYAEFATFHDDRARMSVQYASTVVMLGEDSNMLAYTISHDADLPASMFGPYVSTACLSEGTRRETVPVVLA